jgi:hypothetical protein
MDMTTSLAPDWLKGFEAQENAERLDSEGEAERTASAERGIRAKAPDFMQDLGRELSLLASVLDNTRRVANVMLAGSPRAELHIRVSMRRVSAVPRSTYTDLFYTTGHLAIRVTTVEGESFFLSFCVDEENQPRVVEGASIALMDHKQVAQFIIEKMMRLTKPTTR